MTQPLQLVLPPKDESFRELRRMIGASASVLLLLGIATGGFLEKVRRDAVAQQTQISEQFEVLQERMLAARGAFSRLEMDQTLLGEQNTQLRSSVETALKESQYSLDRMKGLAAQLAVAGAVAQKSLDTVKDAPAQLAEDEEEGEYDYDPEQKIAELERRIELQQKSAMYLLKYAEGGSKDKELLETGLNLLGVTEKQYREIK